MLPGQMNSPQHRVGAAIHDVAANHAQLLKDRLFSGFGGILARLLLQYHLGRCHLPPVLFDPRVDETDMSDTGRLEQRLAALILASYDLILNEESR